MKRIFPVILSMAMFAIVGCGDNTTPPPPPPPAEPFEFEIINNTEQFTSTEIPEMTGTMYETEVYIYDYSNDRLGEMDLADYDFDTIVYGGGYTEVLETPEDASADAEYIKISFKFIPKTSSYYDNEENKRFYTDFFMLTEEEITTVTITSETTIWEDEYSSASGPTKGAGLTLGEALAKFAK